MDGWIKLHRKVLENPIVCKDSDHLAVWSYLLLNATHKEYQAVFMGKKITLLPGQLITGRNSIAERLKISESKVKRILIEFENDQQIDRERSNKNSLISILNWDIYQMSDQQNDQQVTSNRPASDQQVTTNKNVKNVKNERMKEEKIYYAANVSLTESEYQRLCEKYGKELTDESITYLSLYKEEKRYKNKSDNATIQRWVADAVMEKKAKSERNNIARFPRASKTALPVVKPTNKTEATPEDIERIMKMAEKLKA